MNGHGWVQAMVGQTSVFWLATGAIALGLTLMLVAAGFALKRRFARARQPHRPGALAALAAYRAAGKAAPTAAEPAPAHPTPPLAARGSLGPRVAPIPAADLPSLALLLRRLHSAGDRLEDVARDLAGDLEDMPEPALKVAPVEVEYVFKACGS